MCVDNRALERHPTAKIRWRHNNRVGYQFGRERPSENFCYIAPLISTALSNLPLNTKPAQLVGDDCIPASVVPALEVKTSISGHIPSFR